MSWREIYRVHPVAAIFPQLSSQDFDALRDDIREHGLREPVKLWREGDQIYVIDGRNRLDALEQLGLPWENHVTFVDCASEEIPALVVSWNIRRRHLTPRQKIELAVKALQAAAKTKDRNTNFVSKPKKLVSRIASATRLSKPTIYAHRDLLPQGSYREQRSVGPAIAQALATLPPSSETRRGKRGGRIRETASRVAAVTGVCPATVKRYLAQPSNGNGHHFNGGYGKRKPPTIVVSEAKHLTPEDLSLGRAIRALEGVSGQDLTEWGVYHLKIAEGHLARIRAEHEQETVSDLALVEANPA